MVRHFTNSLCASFNEKICQIIYPVAVGFGYGIYTPLQLTGSLNPPIGTLASSTTMDRTAESATAIRRVLEAHPVYTGIALMLGFSVYRWNINRVSYTICAVAVLMTG